MSLQTIGVGEREREDLKTQRPRKANIIELPDLAAETLAALYNLAKVVVLPKVTSMTGLKETEAHMRHEVEILAPAGSRAALQAAIRAGADAVYFGVGKLNMRAGTRNHFNPEDLPKLVSTCHDAGVKAYLTVNTVVYDNEIEELQALLVNARNSGVDAIIAADMAVIQLAREKGLTLHLSTQANISNMAAVRFYATFADVLVLARELTLEQTADIISAVRAEGITGPAGKPLRIEIFVHGALCMAISGRCYLSLHQHNASANRGSCLQLCRRNYTVLDEDREIELGVEDGYLMSPKDLKTVHFLDRIVKAGVAVLKIEGRGRSPDYVACVTQVYREAVDAIAEGKFSAERVEEWDRRLTKVFNRGFWGGYYLGQKTGDWTPVPNSQATHRKEYCGLITGVQPETGQITLRMDSGSLSTGDAVLIIGDDTGVVSHIVDGMWSAESSVARVDKGSVCGLKITEPVAVGDKLYKLVCR